MERLSLNLLLNFNLYLFPPITLVPSVFLLDVYKSGKLLPRWAGGLCIHMCCTHGITLPSFVLISNSFIPRDLFILVWLIRISIFPVLYLFLFFSLFSHSTRFENTLLTPRGLFVFPLDCLCWPVPKNNVTYPPGFWGVF